MREKFDKMYVGLLLGILTPILIFLGYYLINFSYIRLDTYLGDVFMKNIFSPLMSLCVIGNLGVFYLFYWKFFNRAAQGVIFSTFIYALMVVVFKFVL